MSRHLRLVLAGVVAVAAFVLAIAPASAHVTVNPREAQQGTYAKLAFRVPNERPDASTTSVAVQLPTDHPFASVSVRPTPGWTADVARAPLPTPIESHGRQITEAVSTITWSGGSIAPGEFQEFEVSVGPLPEGVDSLVFPAVQTYSSGEVVRWIERPQAGQAEAEHPAPVLTLTPAPADGDGSTTATTTGNGGTAVDQQAAGNGTDGAAIASAAAGEGQGRGDDDDDDDGSGNALAVIALVVGAVGLVTGVGALALARRR